MNLFASKEDFDSCKVTDEIPRAGPISYAVNTAVPGITYIGSGVAAQCLTGRKIAINILKYQVLIEIQFYLLLTHFFSCLQNLENQDLLYWNLLNWHWLSPNLDYRTRQNYKRENKYLTNIKL